MKLLVSAVLAALMSSAPVAPVIAQEYPAKPVRVLSGFAAGGAADIIGRVVAQRLSETLKQPFVVETRAGAAGIIATEAVARSAPDGYTLLVGTMTTHGIAPSLYKKLPYDVTRDFAPVALIGHIPLVMTVGNAVPAASLKEFVGLAKASPGKYTFASAGGGTPPHLTGELFRSTFGLDLVHVPYKGTAPAVTDLIAGQVSMTIDGLTVQLPHIRSGKLKALAAASARRIATIPDVPTFAELGYPDLQVSLWYSLFAPAGTPRPVVSLLNAQVAKMLALPEVRQRLAELAVEPGDGGSPEQFGAFVQAELRRWGEVVQQVGVKLD
jgi:tripartite-type tricarboxylate transporter receptor subunit TctC